MKTIILFVCGLSISGLLYSQNYHPIVQENNEWNVLKVTGFFPPTDTNYWTMTYQFIGDTTINSQVYKKVYISEEEVPNNWKYEGAIREEDRKVWYLAKYESEERKIYDFTLEVSDTVSFVWDPMIVDSISYIELNGEDRKQFWFSVDGQGGIIEHWIEGIGSNYGILQSGGYFIVGWATWFLCMSEEGELIYMNPNFNSCYMFSTEIEEAYLSGIELYPNPVTDKIIIKNSDNIKIESVSLIDLRGQLLLNYKKGVDEIDLSAFPSGMYFIKFAHEDGVETRKILLK